MALELIPAEGNLSPQDLSKLDEAFSLAGDGSFHVGPVDVTQAVEQEAERYRLQVETQIAI